MVLLEYGGGQLHVSVPEFEVSVSHGKKRSRISGAGRLLSDDGPWSLDFQVVESEKQKRMRLAMKVKDFMPRTLAPILGRNAPLNAVELPVSGEVSTELSSTGDVLDAQLDLQLSPGRIALGGGFEEGIAIRDGHVRLAYDSQRKVWDVRESTLRGEGSEVTLEGAVVQDQQRTGFRGWRFALSGTKGWISGPGTLGKEKIQELDVSGRLVPAAERAVIEALRVKLASGEVALRGRTDRSGLQVAGRGRGLDVASLQRIWPRSLAPEARNWVVTSIEKGTVSNVDLAVSMDPHELAETRTTGTVPDRAINLAIDARDVAIRFAEQLEPYRTDKVEILIRGGVLSATSHGGELGLNRNAGPCVRAPRQRAHPRDSGRHRRCDCDCPNAQYRIAACALSGPGADQQIHECLS